MQMLISARSCLRMGVVKPTDDEAKETDGRDARPAARPERHVFLQAAAEEATAKAAKARADTVETVASAELKRAQTLETLGKVDQRTHRIWQ
jgi:hypothetical protein